jgi:hypothetical protein
MAAWYHSVMDQYLAGLIDGEGCLTIVKTKPSAKYARRSPSYYLRLTIQMIHRGVMDKVCEVVGSGSVKKYANGSRRPLYRLEIGGENAKNLIERIFPYLIVKKEEALLCLKFMDLNSRSGFGKRVPEILTEERELIYTELKRLKH